MREDSGGSLRDQADSCGQEGAKVELHLIAIRICQPCLDGEGQECHTPGCALFLHRVDLPVHKELYQILHTELVP